MSAPFTIDRETGEWSADNEPRTLEHRQALIIAASVLPGMTEDELDRLYGEIMEHDDPENRGRMLWVPLAPPWDSHRSRDDLSQGLRDALDVRAQQIAGFGDMPTWRDDVQFVAGWYARDEQVAALEAQVASLRAGGSVAP